MCGYGGRGRERERQRDGEIEAKRENLLRTGRSKICSTVWQAECSWSGADVVEFLLLQENLRFVLKAI